MPKIKTSICKKTKTRNMPQRCYALWKTLKLIKIYSKKQNKTTKLDKMNDWTFQ